MIKFIYTSVSNDEFKDQVSYDNFICDIEITEATYAIDDQGYVYPSIKTNTPEYMRFLHNIFSAMGNNSDTVRIYINVDNISQNDRYSVYSVDDVDGHDHTYALYWVLKSRVALNSPYRSMSLNHSPMVCPLCREPLSESEFYPHSESNNIKRCLNSSCDVHVYTAINRFLIVSCNLPKLMSVFRPYINAGKIHIPSDLYKLDVYDSLYFSDDISSYLEQLAETRGNILFSNYLLSLALVDYNIDGFKINTCAIDSDFSPISFVQYIYNLSNKFVEYHNAWEAVYAERSWLEAYGQDINMYMSIPTFFEYARYFYNNQTNNLILNELVNLGVFKDTQFITLTKGDVKCLKTR